MDNTSPNNPGEQLVELAELAQQYPLGSRERRIALTKLIETINKHSNMLAYPSDSQYPVNLRSEIFRVALQKLFIFICHPGNNIDSYRSDLSKGKVKTWLNVKLKGRFFQEAYNELLGRRIVDGQLVQIPTISDLGTLDNIPSPDQKTSSPNSEIIREYIEKDPGGIFRNEYIGKNTRANFRVIALKRLEDKSWKEISAELGIDAPSTTSSFYYRCLKIFIPQIRAYLQKNT